MSSITIFSENTEKSFVDQPTDGSALAPLNGSGFVSHRSSSWLFRCGNWLAYGVAGCWNWLIGGLTVLVILSILAGIPIFNFLTLGYLLEVSRRVALGKTVSCGPVTAGFYRAAALGNSIFSWWVWLIPIRYLALFSAEAELIAPQGSTAVRTQFLFYLATALVIAHLVAAAVCGGKLRHYFWPFIAPFSLALWMARRMVKWPLIGQPIRWCSDWICFGLTDDIANAPPLKDWLLPWIFWSKIQQPDFVSEIIGRPWRFLTALRLAYYFRLGAVGFLGTAAWLFLPTLLMAVATLAPEHPLSGLAGLLGFLLAVPIFSGLPLMQVHFAVRQDVRAFIEIWQIVRLFRRAPVWYLGSWTVSVALCIPLFLLKIEAIPTDLIWLLSLVFLILLWPGKICLGWAYRQSMAAPQPRRWWLTLPMGILVSTVSAAYVLLLMLTRYTSWNGAFSLFENPVFLLPTPFWLL